ncbi:MAG: acyltransferase family protein [Anaerostipes sp.]|jgi:glucan biosynthesis protein C
MRKHYLDNLRWMTIVLVVIFHIYFYYNNIGVQAMFSGRSQDTGSMSFSGIYQYFVYPWFMLLLFIIAGISARYALKKKTKKQFIKSRIDKLLVPSTLGILAFGWIGGLVIFIHTASVSMPKDTPAVVGVIITICSGIGALWFCQVLFVAVLVLTFVRFILSKIGKTDDDVCNWFVDRMKSSFGFFLVLIILFLVLWGGSHILNMPMITSYRNGIYIPAFLMGFYIFSNEQIINQLKKYIAPFFILTLISGAFYLRKCYGLYYGDIHVLSRFDLNLYAFFMIIFLLGVGVRWLNVTNTWMTYMKNISFGIYVFHIPVLLVTNYILVDSKLPMTMIYMIELVSAFLNSIILYEVIRRIPVLRYWILGIRKHKNNP